MVDEFQAFLLLGVTGLLVYIVMRVVREDLAARLRVRRRTVPARPQPPS
jgi:hypothetical protein